CSRFATRRACCARRSGRSCSARSSPPPGTSRRGAGRPRGCTASSSA
ncbi:MAG: hypothetical protein AVDCRST_MAG02-1848, partial [uncultured Rubrobacteraceae bacterium]